ncbi:MAG: hypothetical protein LUI14_04515 [Lachnospiraceae bacterium]|nr:hypothetical protein [Lachnospiraceae bacterium]
MAASRIKGITVEIDGDVKCGTPHLTDEEIMEKFVSAVNRLLECRDSIIEGIELIKNIL